MIRRPPNPPLFPYTPFSQSELDDIERLHHRSRRAEACDFLGFNRLAAEDHDRNVYQTAFPAQSTDDVGTRHRSEEHTSELQSLAYLVCRLLLEKKNKHTRI